MKDEIVKDKKIRKVFLDDLPRLKGNRINWKESLGCVVKVDYEGDIYYITIINYNKQNQKITIQWKDRQISLRTGDFTSCKIGKLIKRVTNEFKLEIGQILYDKKRHLMIIDRRYIKNKKNENIKHYKYKCLICGFDGNTECYSRGEKMSEYWILEYALMKGVGCLACATPSQIIVPGINDIATTHPELVKCFQNGYDDAKRYAIKSNALVNLKCPYCGRLMNNKPVTTLNGNTLTIPCSCGDGFSKGHKYLVSFLKQLDINYEEEVKFDWCKFKNLKNDKLRIGFYDFVVEDLKLIIEVDGGWHRKDNLLNRQTKEESAYIDNMKDLLAEQNGYKVIRISDEGSLKSNILNSELRYLCESKSLNWEQCEKFSSSNMAKQIVDYWNKKKDWETTLDVAKRFNIARATVIRYLNDWRNIGCCNYNPKEEARKGSLKTAKTNKRIFQRKIEVFKNGISCGIFNGCNELARVSQDIFNVKFTQQGISITANGGQSHHKGYTFKYVDEK